jgi:hypothetical protein
MPQIRRQCKGECKRKVRFTAYGYDKYGMCRPCYKRANGRRRPVVGRVKKQRTPVVKAAKPQPQKGKK